MVLSVFAATMTFAGSAVALNDATIDLQTVDLSEDTTYDNSTHSLGIEVQSNDIDGQPIEEIIVQYGSAADTDNIDASGVTADVSVGGSAVTVNDVTTVDTGAAGDDEIYIDVASTTASVGDSVNITLDDVQNPVDADTYSVSATFDDTDDTSVSGSTASSSNTFDVDPSLVITAADAPAVSPADTEIDATFEITNQGSSNATGDVTFAADASDAVDVAPTVADTDNIATLSTGSLTSGESTNLTFTANTTTSYGGLTTDTAVEDIFHGIYVEDSDDGSNAEFDSQAAVPFKVGVDDVGSINPRVDNVQGDRINNADVELYLSGNYPGGTPIRTGQTNANGAITFDDLAVGPNRDPDAVGYVVRAEKEGFESGTTEVLLYTPDQTSPSPTVTLQSDVEAEFLDVVRYDSDDQQVLGEDATLLANGQSGNTAEFAAIAQTNTNTSLSNDLDVTFSFTGDDEFGNDLAIAGDIDGAFDEEAPGDFIDNETHDRTFTATIPNTSAAAYDVSEIENSNLINDESLQAPSGSLSLITFEVTADDANRTVLEEPIVTERFSATAQNESGFTLDNLDDGYNNVTYALKGNQTISGEVEATGDDDPIEDATVWVAYDGAEQTPEAAANFAGPGQDAFLIDSTDSDGRYVITGIAGDDGDQDFNIYVKTDTDYQSYTGPNYNDENLTGTAGAFQGIVADFDLTQNTNDVSTQGTTINSDKSFILEEPPLAYDLEVFVEDENQNGNFVKETTVPDGDDRDVRLTVDSGPEDTDPDTNPGAWGPAQNKDVELEVINESVGQLAGADADGEVTVTTNADGNATIEFTAEPAATTATNITAETTNADDVVYRTDDPTDPINEEPDQARIDVFAGANIEGDVVDVDDQEVIGAEVTLERVFANGTRKFIDNTTTGPSGGSFAFTEVPAGFDYRVSASFTNDDGQTFTGFNEGQLEDLPAGTTTAGITLGDLELDDDPGTGLPTDPGEPSFQDVLGVIDAFNNDQPYNGVDVTFQDVLAVIDAFNAGS